MTGPALATGVFPKAGGDGGGSGNVTGPDAAADGNFAAFDGADGKKIRDGGFSASSFATAAQGLLASTALQPGAQIPWADVTGKPDFGSAALEDAADFAAAVHTHTASQISDASANGQSILTAADYSAMRTLLSLVKGTSAGNIPVLDDAGKLDTSILPAIAITEPFVVPSQAAMLALSAQMGDVAIRTDLNKTFILATNNPGTLADWKEMLTPTDLVLSVAGLTGAISASALKTALAITAADITNASANGRSLITAADYAVMRTLLGLVIGTNVQAQNAKLSNIAALSPATGDTIVWNGSAYISQAGGGSVIKSMQSGFVSSTTLSTGTGEDAVYLDVTVSSVDPSKCFIDFDGSFGNNAAAAQAQFGTSGSGCIATLRMTSATNLRISGKSAAGSAMTALSGRWTITEFNA
ncbi:hypothetical protein P7F60_11985 [Rhizobium sp. YJ-22]|uniref:hypothetical protein n=1 Tax=Rhizobium sp. YJ-22 TaxID=3037556 RepID=UPI0024127F17|nr:hypothetical protein [Rhizobium sp. YJ-22]MDG3577112.1 hypothetical protein [Rhizobium sp. YJ-22]